MINIINETNPTALAAIMIQSLLCCDVKKIPFSLTSKHSPDTSYKKVRKQLISFFAKNNIDYQTKYAFLKSYKLQELFNAASDPDFSAEISELFSKYQFNEFIEGIKPLIDENFEKNAAILRQYLPALLKALGISEDIDLYFNFVPVNLQGGAHFEGEKPSFCIGYYEFYLKHMQYDVLLHEMCHALINTFMKDFSSDTTIVPFEVYENKTFEDIHVFQSEVLARVFTAFMMHRGQMPDYAKALKFYEFMGWQRISKIFVSFDLLVRNKAYDIITDRNALIEELSIK